ncbi:MAG: SRPBCC family protein [Verrucomicrobiales bacterium]|nr:SRPBCC family protein [Verrucomicrobiales bacterium]
MPNPVLPATLVLLLFLSSAFPNDISSPEYWIKTHAHWTSLEEGEVVLLESPDESKPVKTDHAAIAAILIDSPVAQVWDIVNDQDKAPDYMKTLLSSELLEEHEGYSLIQQQVKVGFHQVEYVVRHMPTPTSVIEFERQSGDLKSMNGFWRFIEVGKEGSMQTLLIYRLSLQPDFPIPPFLIRKSLSDNLPDTLISIRDELIRNQENPP